MPRVSRSSGEGRYRVPGIYAELLERERSRWESSEDPRRRAESPQAAEGTFRRPRGLVDALEAGDPVLVRRRAAELAHGRDFRFPWAGGSVKTVQVSRNDVVAPSDREIPWFGCVAANSFR